MGRQADNGKYLVFNTLNLAIAANEQIYANLLRAADAAGEPIGNSQGQIVPQGTLPANDALLTPFDYFVLGVKNGNTVVFPESSEAGWDTPWQRATDNKYVIRKPQASLMTNVGGTVEVFDPSWEGTP